MNEKVDVEGQADDQSDDDEGEKDGPNRGSNRDKLWLDLYVECVSASMILDCGYSSGGVAAAPLIALPPSVLKVSRSASKVVLVAAVKLPTMTDSPVSRY